MYFELCDAGCASLPHPLYIERGGRLFMKLSLGSYFCIDRSVWLGRSRTRAAPRFQDPCPNSSSKSVGVKPILQGTVALAALTGRLLLVVSVSVAGIGMTASNAEAKLRTIQDKAAPWRAVLLRCLPQ
jgi:hypothetical protein